MPIKSSKDNENLKKNFKENERLFSQLFNNMTSGAVIYEAVDNGSDFIIKDFNRTAERIEKIKKNQVIGLKVTKAFPGVKKFGLFKVFQEVWKTGKARRFPSGIYQFKGITSWRENFVYKLPNNNIIAIYNDITEIKNIESLKRQSEEKFSKIFQISPYAITITNATTGKFLDINKAFTLLTGYTRKETLASSSIDLNLWVNKKDRNQVLADLRDGRIIFNREYQFRKKNGEVGTGLYSAQTILFGNDTCIMSCITDITDRKKVQTLIIDTKTRNEAILNSIGDAVFACDKEGKILLFNPVAEELTGVPAKEAIGLHYTQVIKAVSEITGQPCCDIVTEAIKSDKVVKMSSHALLVNKDGSKIPISDSAAPIKNISGEIIGCVVVFHDVTEERQIDKTKSEFVSLASHQLRTPLSTINWYLEMLMSSELGSLTPKQQQYSHEIYNASKRMVNLVNALLNVSRLELGTFTTEPTVINIRNLVKTCLKEFNKDISEKKLTVSQNFNIKSFSIKSDIKFLTIIIQNLLSNSIKYTNKGGKIVLSISKDKNNILIKVSDNGIGIPQDQQKKIFTKLFRADNARIMDPDGSGLGLYIVKEIVNNIGGKIWFKSKEGKGTTFYIDYPESGAQKIKTKLR